MVDKKETIHRIETCYFYREEHGKAEIGILLNEGDLGIIDKFGKLVEECWTWERFGFFVLDLDLAELEEKL